MKNYSRKEPKDDGGCELKHYIVECLDLSMGNMWVTVAMAEGPHTTQIEAR